MSNFKCPTFNSMERWKLYGELTRQVELYKTKIEETSSIEEKLYLYGQLFWIETQMIALKEINDSR